MTPRRRTVALALALALAPQDFGGDRESERPTIPSKIAVVAAAALAVLLAGGCARGGTAKGRDDSTGRPPADRSVPTFPPAVDTATTLRSDAEAAGSPKPTSSPPPSTVAPADARPKTTGAPAPTPSVTPTLMTASLQDAAGDASPSLIDKAPPSADLTDARLTRSPDGFELRVGLGGPAAPSTSGDSDHTMNVATFFDADGDGRVDYEVWANLDSGGWGTAYFDDVRGSASYRERSGVQVRPEGGEIVLTFPLAHLGSAASFGWSLALEWARYETLGSPTSVKDQAPDGGAPAAFPS